MIVTFISQCEHKALNRTRRVLDAFANRIGSRTWQTVITEDGLQAVKKLLRKSATKNTAVSCHWIRSRRRSELAWLIGNRDKFNPQGHVPVNWTRKKMPNNLWENNWDTLPIIQSLTALAALFHDWGKASACFQEKLNPNSKHKRKGDPLRHEWVSVLLLSAFVDQQTDVQWLERLAQGEFDEQDLIKSISTSISDSINYPLENLPPLASIICWLIVSHHRLPLPNKNIIPDDYNIFITESAPDAFQELLEMINVNFGYANLWDDGQRERRKECFDFPLGLPCQSNKWRQQAKRWAVKLSQHTDTIKPLIENGSWRLIIFYSRLSLMLGDHQYSSQEVLKKWSSDYEPLANTYFKTVNIAGKWIEKGTPKQKLDQHLIGVKESAIDITRLLPAFETELKPAYDVTLLKQKSPVKSPYYWQDKAVMNIQAWRKTLADDQQRYGFFAVNMASTGCGKTMANAKIMRALSGDGNSLRYILALGLRTLTLQTGDEYRNRIGLGDDELAVMIGSRAIMELHNNQSHKETDDLSNEASGSESQEFLLDDNFIDYDCTIPEERLSTLLKTQRDKQFLYAPVLACTIDHIMPATETQRGGRYILPSLRLMSSDLVIDEIDDFTGHDLIAIGRLIHLTGMLGRKVMISSATIPPDLAVGYFNAYQQGWKLFAQTRHLSQSIGCAWIDEDKSNSQVHSIHGEKEAYQTLHQKFIHKRIQFLSKRTVKRKATIIPCSKENDDNNNDENLQERYFSCIQQAIIEKHQQHFETDLNTQKQVSFGVVRMANIAPCVALTQYLLKSNAWGDGLDVRIMAYHSQQILLLRHEQEKHLDAVLKRNTKEGGLGNALIKTHLQKSNAKNIIFIVVATPVEEVGRDHDFDWAVIEPSSFRSIIQLAGRVLRHREESPEHANLAIMQYNLKAILQKETPYSKPGYEDENHALPSDDLNDLLADEIQHKVDAIPRIADNPALKNPFADLEHRCIGELLTAYENKKVSSLQGWLTECWWLTALPQQLTPFRKSQKQRSLYLVLRKEEWVFVEKDDKNKLTDSVEGVYKIKTLEVAKDFEQRLWLTQTRDYVLLLEALADEKKLPLNLAASRYGELSCRASDLEGNSEMLYSDQLGMVKA